MHISPPLTTDKVQLKKEVGKLNNAFSAQNLQNSQEDCKTSSRKIETTEKKTRIGFVYTLIMQCVGCGSG